MKLRVPAQAQELQSITYIHTRERPRRCSHDAERAAARKVDGQTCLCACAQTERDAAEWVLSCPRTYPEVYCECQGDRVIDRRIPTAVRMTLVSYGYGGP